MANHSLNPLDKLGWVTETRIKGNTFQVKVSWKEKKYREQLKDTKVSVFSLPKHIGFDKTRFKHALVHVGMTDYPVLKG